MGVWDWITSANPPDLSAITTFTAEGRNWLLMPYREITLVHAAQRPLSNPSVLPVPGASRGYGATSAVVPVTVSEIDGKSTGKVDIAASWTDPLDTGTGALQSSSNGGTSVGTFGGTPDGTPGAIQVSLKPSDQLSNLFTFDAGDTKYHKATYKLTASTRFREYFPPTTSADAMTRPLPSETSNIFVSAIPNTLRPDAPIVQSVIPSFNWERAGGDDILPNHHYTVERKGNILRVYLNRPWFSSGAGELLGVVFKRETEFTQLAQNLKSLVTQWGSDPAFDASPAPTSASLANFSNYSDFNEIVKLQEVDQVVSVVGYPITLDETRNLWYGDVEMSLGEAYVPFDDWRWCVFSRIQSVTASMTLTSRALCKPISLSLFRHVSRRSRSGHLLGARSPSILP